MKLGFRRPSPSMLVALTALVVALGGTSYAAFSLPKNSVGSKQLENGAVTTKKLANGAVTGSKVNAATLGLVPQAGHAVNSDFSSFATNAGFASTARSAPSSIVATSTSCFGPSPFAEPCDLSSFAWSGGSPTTVNLGAGQAVIVAANARATSISNQIDLALGICAVPTTDPGTNMTAYGGGTGIHESGVQEGIPVSLIRIIKASALGGAGTYQVGMCYRAVAGFQGATEESTVSTIVVNLS